MLGGGLVEIASFERLLAQAPIGAALLDAQGRYLWVNAALAAANGRPPAAHVNRPVREVVPAIADVVEAALADVLAGRPPTGPVELTVPDPDEPGGLATWRQSWYPVTGEDGARLAMVLAWRDADARAAASTSERLELALASGGLGTWDWDLKADHIAWDERTAGIFGVQLADFGGSVEEFRSRIHPDDRASVGAAIEEAIAMCGELRREYRVVHPRGAVRWVSVRGRVLTDADGAPESMVGVVQDRTETRSRAERLARTLEAIDEGFFALDRDWRFTYVNARAEEILERSRVELVGADVWERYPSLVGTAVQRHYEAVARDGRPVTFEVWFAPLERWMEVRAYPEPDGIAVYFRDIGERKRREEARRAQEEVERRAHRAAAELLDVTRRMHTDPLPEEAAAAACAVGRRVFGCSRVSLWHVESTTGSLLGQDGGAPLDDEVVLDVAEHGGIRAAIESGRAAFYAGPDDAGSPAEAALARQVGARSYVYAPVELGEGAGMLLAVLNWDEEVPPVADPMLGVMLRYAQQSALAVEQARRLRAQRRTGELSAQLQANLLRVPELRGTAIEVASLYEPGERRLLLGGDFYDLVEDDTGGISVVIGDVTGHGPEAAAIGAALRAGWRMLALDGVAPAAAVAALDRLLRSERDDDEQLVSVCCARLDAGGRSIDIASAGHPPPIIVTPTGSGLVAIPPGLLLGLPVDGGWGSMRLDLPERWALLLYTDGLPEARTTVGCADRLGSDRFTDHVARVQPLEAADLGAALSTLAQDVRRRSGEPIEDDVALLALRRRR
jgi:PAS domain S-box-containing protein